MKYLDFKEQFKDFLVFSLDDIRKFNPSFHRQRLNEWQRRGYLKKIIREHYIFSDLEINEAVLFIIANKIFHPSYVSLETALAYYGLIPESVYTITSATSRKTYSFNSPVANFDYKKIRPGLMFGYSLLSYNKHSFKIAETEKAILDYFYLNPRIKTAREFTELRFNKETFKEQVNLEKLKNYTTQFQNKALEERVNNFINFITANA